MNGIPVYPLSKNGERPYLASPKTQFSTRFLGLFWGYSGAEDPPPTRQMRSRTNTVCHHQIHS